MSFPASEAFADDDRVTPTQSRVYRFCYRNLDLCEPRECKLAWLAHGTRVHERHLVPILRTLVAWGYLIEHWVVEKADGRPPVRRRLLTLAHSVRADKRQAA